MVSVELNGCMHYFVRFLRMQDHMTINSKILAPAGWPRYRVELAERDLFFYLLHPITFAHGPKADCDAIGGAQKEHHPIMCAVDDLSKERSPH